MFYGGARDHLVTTPAFLAKDTTLLNAIATAEINNLQMSIDHNSFFYSLPWLDVLIPFLIKDFAALSEDKSLDVARTLSFFQPIVSTEQAECDNLPTSSLFAFQLDPGLYEFQIPNNLSVTVQPCSTPNGDSLLGRQYYPKPYGLLSLETKSFVRLEEGNKWYEAIANFHKYER